MLAMLYAISAVDEHELVPPDRLVLISPAPVNRAFRKEFDDALRRRSNTPELVAERQRLMASGLREEDPDAYRQRLFELGVSGYFANPLNAHDLTPFRVVGRVQESTWESLGDYNLLPGLERVRVPSCIVHGRDDPIPPASSVAIARALDSNLVLIDHCGHVPYVEQPAELWAAIDPFLTATDSSISS
jgi:proline iminopeptidase